MSFYPEPAEYGKKRIWNPESTYKFEKNNLMQICTVISASRMPGKQDSRTLWLNVLKRKGRREIGKIPFLCGQFPVYPFSGFTLYADSKSVRKNMLHDEVYCRLVRK